MDENNLQPNAADAKTPEQPEDLLHHLECDLNEPAMATLRETASRGGEEGRCVMATPIPDIKTLVQRCRDVFMRIPVQARADRRRFRRLLLVTLEAWEVEGNALSTEPTVTPEDTLREAGISSRRQARYQRRMSSLLAGRE